MPVSLRRTRVLTAAALAGLAAGKLRNPAGGLVMDVYGSSASAGAAIDTWYDNNGDNQYFTCWQLG